MNEHDERRFRSTMYALMATCIVIGIVSGALLEATVHVFFGSSVC